MTKGTKTSNTLLVYNIVIFILDAKDKKINEPECVRLKTESEKLKDKSCDAGESAPEDPCAKPIFKKDLINGRFNKCLKENGTIICCIYRIVAIKFEANIILFYFFRWKSNQNQRSLFKKGWCVHI